MFRATKAVYNCGPYSISTKARVASPKFFDSFASAPNIKRQRAFQADMPLSIIVNDGLQLYLIPVAVALNILDKRIMRGLIKDLKSHARLD